jgi:hypothetical protein
MHGQAATSRPYKRPDRRKSQQEQSVKGKIDFRLTTSSSLSNLRRDEQYRVEFW